MLPQILVVNPMAKRRRRQHSRHHSYRASNPFRHHRKHRHSRRVSNPFALPSSHSIMGDLTPAAIGGAGAVGLDILLAYIPLPATFQTGWGNYLAKIAGSFGLGMIAGAVTDKRKAEMVTVGALTVSLYTIIRSLAQQTIGTSVKGLSGLADFKDYSVRPGMGAYMQPRLGAYMNPGTMLRPGTMVQAPTTPGGVIRTRQMGAYMRGSRAGGAFASGY